LTIMPPATHHGRGVPWRAPNPGAAATAEDTMTERIHGYCALCRSRCGCVSVVADGRLVAVEPDPSHPTGRALCAKGRAAPQLVYHPERLLHPLRRTRPKGDPEPGWERVAWDEALDLVATRLRSLADAHGPETVAFAVTSPSGTAISDAAPWIDRLINAFGSPNNCYATEICNWHKDHATRFTFGHGVAAPDLERAGCVLYWGHNPSTSWLTHATGAVAARARGARLIVVDPRRAGLAAKADLWLRVRPGADGALALGIAGVMINEGWFDREFVRDWTNGPFLVRADTGRFLTERDLAPRGAADRQRRGPGSTPDSFTGSESWGGGGGGRGGRARGGGRRSRPGPAARWGRRRGRRDRAPRPGGAGRCRSARRRLARLRWVPAVN
jgi:anaerobic selenocysteine-containing dehydrogenase